MRHFIWVVALGVAGPLAAQNQPADNSDKPDKPPLLCCKSESVGGCGVSYAEEATRAP